MMTSHEEKPAGMLAQHSEALIIGLGLTGYSVVRYLAAKGLQLKVIDTRQVAPFGEQLQQAYPEVPVYQGELGDTIPSRLLREAGLVVVSPGVSIRQPELAAVRARGADLVGDIELFVEQCSKPCVAVTGSNGKSTVTTLVGEICRSAGLEPLIGGNIGLPVLDALTENRVFETAVLELSSFQLETTSGLAARAAVLLNVSDDHLDRYHDMDDYLDAKLQILDGAEVAVLNRDDERVFKVGTARLQSETGCVTFGLGKPPGKQDYGLCTLDGAEYLVRGGQKLMPVEDCMLQGRHNLMNILAAWAAGSAVEATDECMADTVREFKGLPHRTELIGVIDGVSWINDSKATNPGATAAALYGSSQPVILIAGGQAKGADFSMLAAALSGHAKALILFGEDAESIGAALEKCTPVNRVEDLEQAVAMARELATSGDAVLLSPACASFDMFRGYAHRGDEFRRLVQGLRGGLD
jgi:UDP-N-acetylmuramoylalanine--D-glutamate ligase